MSFLELLAGSSAARIVCEPRHASWFEDEADTLLRDLEIARVAADPVIVEAGAEPGGWPGLTYHRLHGSPAIYRSSYDDGRVHMISQQILDQFPTAPPMWIVFDNTASGAATGDALSLLGRMPARTPLQADSDIRQAAANS